MTQIEPPPAGSPYTPGPPPAGLPYQGGPPPGSIPQQQGPPGYPPQPPPRRTNVLAVLALILAILIAPIGLILGIVALTQIRKRGESGTGLAVAGVVIGAIGTLFWVGLTLLLALATPTLETDSIEGQIGITTGQAAGTTPTAITCPDSVEVQPGGTFTCTATVAGQNLPFTVTQKDDQGNVDIQGTGWAPTARAEQTLVEAATQNFPERTWTATCADGKDVVVGGPGTTFPCTLSVVDNPEMSEPHTATIKNANGDVDIS